MIDAYLNQSVKWGKRIGVNGHGEAVYSETYSRCRIERDNRLVEGVGGEKVQFATRVYINEQVETGDTIDGLRVKAVEIMNDLYGDEVWRVAIL